MNKKIVFGDDGEVISAQESIKNNKNQYKQTNITNSSRKGTNKSKHPKTLRGAVDEKVDESQKWFEVYSKFNSSDGITELKVHELSELSRICKTNFESELPRQAKNNPKDAKWLETALHKGTAKDRSNAGALLVLSNPLANLSALKTLIGFCKHSNRSNIDVMNVLTDLFIEGLLPPDRKLIPITLRGTDWNVLKKQNDIADDIKNQIYAHWYFENELKDHFFEFLKNLQQITLTGQDANKNVAIISAAKLLSYGPEKEQMLLSMLINKLGDPSNKVASKALHHLTELAYKHPNMCGVITDETQKLLFRNNVSERAQHFALSFLSQIAPRGHSDVCTKLVNICFAFFKILVTKGAINNKTMQALLRCLQKSIVDAKPLNEGGQIMTKEMEDIIYRLVHLADIKISIQTLSLLLQIITVKSENSDRYYNALYRKLLDLNLILLGNNAAGQFLHIVHKSIHIDRNIARAQAFIKRLLQLSLYMPSHMVCGTLIIIHKLLKLKPELLRFEEKNCGQNQVIVKDEILAKFDNDDEEEKYEDVKDSEDEKDTSKRNGSTEENVKPPASWLHLKNVGTEYENGERKLKVSEIVPTKYDPYHRVPAYAGAEYSQRTELILLREHYHPTAKIFAENILNGKKIDYYGDPLKDFGLSHFLNRFSFKNPKKLNEKNGESAVHMLYNRSYLPHGARGQPVHSLTKTNCTEDELFIFNYLEKKRENQIRTKADNNDDDDIQSVDDEEFEEYLDSLCKKTKNTKHEEEDEFDVDYLKELGDDLKENERKVKTIKRKKKIGDDDDDDEDSDTIENDWGDDDDDDDDEDEDEDEDENEDEEEENKEEIESEDDMDIDEEILEQDNISCSQSSSSNNSDEESDDSFNEPKKKFKKSADNFSKTLKNQKDMRSLFAAADDFANLLEETGKTKGHGTLNEVFNKDKSSEKQLKWEEKRRSGFSGGFKGKRRFKKTAKNKKQ